MTEIPSNDIYPENLFPEQPADAAGLLEQLTRCRVGFDAQAEHRYGIMIIPKVATVPVGLFEALKAFLAVQAKG